MKRIYFTIVVSLIATMLLAQVPQGFNYTAIVRNADGTAVKNKEVNLEVALQNDDASEVYYTEQHKVKTNNNGVLSVVIGSGTTTDDFSAIPWEKGNIFVQLKVDDKPLTATKLQSVPYALYAQSGGGNTSNSDVLFAVKNKQGDTVFAVYPEGVRVYVDKNGKAQRGGFAVATRGFGKGNEPTEVFTVTPDSTRVYINEDKNGKAQRGGFAIATRGFSKQKGTKQSKEVFTVESNHNVKVVVDGKSKSKALRGGFAVATRGFSNKGEGETDKTIFTTTADSTRVYLNEKTNDKAQRGGFAIATRGFSKGEIQNNFDISNSKQAEVINGENRILWYPKKNAFMTGKIVVESADSVGENSFASGYESKAMGAYSTAIGNKAIAKDSNSFAFGENAQALGVKSYAIGRGAQAIGRGSFAFGSGCPAGSEDGNPWEQAGAPKAKGQYSYAFGLGSLSQGYGSVTMGFKDTASGTFGIAMGYRARSLGNRSVALGRYATAIGVNSVALGGARAIGANSVAIMGGWAAQQNSVAIGEDATTNANYSVAIGFVTESNGVKSICIGSKSTANGWKSCAIGHSVVAEGRGSTSMGSDIRTEGEGSFGIGLHSPNFYISSSAPSIKQDHTMAIMGGKVGIDTVAPDKKFVVNGDSRFIGNIYLGKGNNIIHSKPDFVFSSNYTKNYTIAEIEKFIEENSHLPWLTSAKEEEEQGVNLTRMSFETLEAVENQQLQIIKLKKENDTLKSKLQKQEDRINTLEQQNKQIENLQKQLEELKKMITD